MDTRGQEVGAREDARSGISCVFVRQSRPAAAPCWAAPLHPGQAAPEGGTEEGPVTRAPKQHPDHGPRAMWQSGVQGRRASCLCAPQGSSLEP